VVVTWSGTAYARSYGLEWSTDQNFAVPGGQVSAVASPYRVKNLSNNTACWVRLTASNRAGTSAPSAAQSATPVVMVPASSVWTRSDGVSDKAWSNPVLYSRVERSTVYTFGAGGAATWDLVETTTDASDPAFSKVLSTSSRTIPYRAGSVTIAGQTATVTWNREFSGGTWGPLSPSAVETWSMDVQRTTLTSSGAADLKRS
jgi:hypothetical protein